MFTLCTKDKNSMYIIRSEDVQEVLWKSYVPYVLCLLGKHLFKVAIKTIERCCSMRRQ